MGSVQNFQGHEFTLRVVIEDHTRLVLVAFCNGDVVLQDHGQDVSVEVVVPPPEDRAYVHERYFAELVGSVFRRDTREGILAVIRRMQERDGIDRVILGGTELPLLFRDLPPSDLPMLDTTRIHIEAALDRLLAL